MTAVRPPAQPASLEEIEEEYDSDVRFRPTVAPASWLVTGLLIAMSLYHYYTAGFGTPATYWHTAIHLSFVLSLIFLVFGLRRTAREAVVRSGWLRPGGIPLIDWLFAVAVVAAALYIPLSFSTLALRVGNPNTLDLVFGTAMVLLLLEATRRAMGWPLTIIAMLALGYALFGRHVPGVFQHPGSGWASVINHIYLQQEGIFGLPIVVVSTFVFHFVLFGVVATKMGLGQLFIDLAQALAGRYAGGPAKVSVISSAMLGTISGSSVANTVTTGALTIPAMKRVGFKPHFAGAVEAASSTGGQITPPIMGAAAFIMVEFLAIPYATIIIAAIVPALMHYIAVFTIVHLEAKRTGLKGLPPEDVPRALTVLKRGWPTLIPLILLVAFIFMGYTPFMAAFWGITACIAVGLVNPMQRIGFADLVNAFATAAKYAIAVGAAAATVGIVVGVITLSGVGFKISFTVTQIAANLADDLLPLLAILPFEVASQAELTLFLTLLFVAMTCVVMGAGVPTTALYIILVTLAAPALKLMGVPDLAAHFFVLYYGVLADLTPPVCVAAYAAAAIANANPFRTGVTAFMLGNAKIMVPFVFVYSPAMLIVLPEYFSWSEFLSVSITCALGIFLLGGAAVGYMFGHLNGAQRLLLLLGSVLLVAPGWNSNIAGIVLAGLALGWQALPARRRREGVRT